MNIETKKIPVSIIIISLTFLLISFLIKEPRDYNLNAYFISKGMTIPLSEYNINILGLAMSLESIVIVMFSSTALGLYLYLYKTDEQIKTGIKSFQLRIKKKQKTSVKSTYQWLIIIALITIPIILFIIGIIYYSFLSDEKRPLTILESFFMGFSKVFIIVAIISIAISIFKSLINNKAS